MTTDHRIGITIETQTKGDEKLRAVADEVRNLGEGAGRAQPQFNALADEIEGLAAQQGAIDSFRTLKRETTDLGNQLNQATARVDALAQELEQAGQSSRASAAAQAQATKELDTARAAQAAFRDAIRTSSEELGTMRAAAQQAVPPELAAAIEEAVQKLAALKTEAKEADGKVQQLAAAHDEFTEAIKQAGQASEASAAAQAQAAKELDAARAAQAAFRDAIRTSSEELGTMRAAAQQAVPTELTAAIGETRQQLAALKVEGKNAGDNVKLLAAAQKEATAISGNAAASEKKLTAEYERTVRLAGSLSTAYGAKNRALEAARAEAQKLGLSTQQLQQSQEQVNTSVQRSKDALQQLTQRYTGLGHQAQDTGDQTQRSHRKISEGVQSISSQLSKLQTAMTGLFAADKLLGYGKEAIAVADAYGQMAERIRMATVDQQEYELVQQRLFESANTTYRALAEQQELYISTADTLRSLGYQTEQVLDITDSFTYLLTTNAASADKGRSAIDAYTKSIMSGKVEADSWKTIMGAMPTVVDAIATSTGKSAEQIRQLGISGKLSVQDLNEGLRQSMQANKEAASGMASTVSDAMTRLSNSWGRYIGEANQSNQATQRMVGVLDLLSDNLDSVVRAATLAGEVLVAVLGVKALGALRAYTTQLAVAATQTSALMGATAAAGAGMATALAAAGKLAAAGWIGWEIGTYLRAEFEVVERAGIHMAEVLHKAAVYAQAGWEMIKAAFTDDTIAAATERMNAQLKEIENGYAQLLASVGKTESGQNKNTQATQNATAALEAHKAVVLDENLALAAYNEQVEALRLRWEEAQTKLEQVHAAQAKGVATAQEAEVAQIQLNAAKRDYVDALNGVQEKLNAHHALEKAGLDVEGATLRLSIEKQRAIYEVAKARGDEAGAAHAMNEIRKLEIQLMEITAEAKRAEAQAAMALLEVKRAELIASGEYEGIKRLEIDAQIKAAEAKQVEAQIADVTAKKLRELAWVQEYLGDSTQKTTGHIDKQTQALQGLENAAEKAAQQVSAAQGGGSFSALAYQQNAKDVHELDAWWEEFRADYYARNSKNRFNTSGTSFDSYWIDVQEAQYRNARRDIEMQERIEQKASTARAQASTGAATYVSNITLPGGQARQLRFADSASQSAAEQLLRELAQAQGVAA